MSSRGQPRQGELFASTSASTTALSAAASPVRPETLPLLHRQILAWQGALASHQQPLFNATAAGLDPAAQQGLLFGPPSQPQRLAGRLDPLSLTPQSLSFWRWPSSSHQGAAVYLVMDRPAEAPCPLLLYVGETSRADRRWKGDHDCKSYLSAYGEALRAADLQPQLSIRFWCDVPSTTAARRALEQALIQQWLPPFNKETRERWSTPFTALQD
ncbi:GIY-YIG nuclease family protein [Synechococcus sp. CS-1328]|uniref:GIY-YIG nuclease family protein n=1 Tax=Synechococcus sp. CS-1328 TaxID=2847976 RepID=UPI00223BB9F9|nr:GIY-YIG nuclease family protein [Synechococcus sp. CS-1328]